MIGTSLRLGRIFGIPLGLNYSWFIIFALVTFSLARTFHSWFPTWSPPELWIVAVATSLLFFVSVLVHELSHSLMALHRRIPVRGITLFVFGGVSHIAREAATPWEELVVAVVGPLTSLLLGSLMLGLNLLVAPVSTHLDAMTAVLFIVNVALGIFNLVPGFPLDGGRVLRSLLWGMLRNYALATRIATGLGQVVASILVAAGVFILFSRDPLQGMWLILIGGFLGIAAFQTYRHFQLREALGAYTARQVMAPHCPEADATWTLLYLVNQWMPPKDTPALR